MADRIPSSRRWLALFHDWQDQQKIVKEKRPVSQSLRISEELAEAISKLAAARKISENDLKNEYLVKGILFDIELAEHIFHCRRL